jgi:hypothetical protein
MEIRDTIGTGCTTVGVRVVTLEGVRMTILTASRLRNVWDDLHATRHSTSRTTAAGSISRGSGAAKALSELLHKRHGDIVSGDVDGIRNTKDDKRPLSGEGQAGVGGIQTSTGGFLDLANATTTLTDDRTNEDMGDQQTQGVGLGLGSGGGIKGFIVQGTDDQTECLA